MRPFVTGAEWVVLTYFLGLHLTYLALNLVAFWGVARQSLERAVDPFALAEPSLLPPVTIVIPAHNEEAVIEASVRSVLQLTYPTYEVVVVNDGSTDRTLDVLVETFDMEPYAEAYRDRVPTEQVRAFYVSRRHPNLRVADKRNGGRSDALNVGLNAARHPLVCTIDADSILQRDSLQRVVRPFLEDGRTVASGGTVRIANGCVVRGGFLERSGLPRKPLLLFQVNEYLRAFLFGRLGWASMNGLLVLSGAFGMFRKEQLVAAGGFRTDTIGEDMEAVCRLHRTLGRSRRPYRVAYVPDPICWTEAPDTLKGLASQRIRWQQGLGEALMKNRGALFRRGTGTVGWVSMPYHIVFELFGPAIEVVSYVLAAVGFATGAIGLRTFVAFAFVSLGLGLALSASSLVLEELSFRVYPRARDLGLLVLAAVGENVGYRQIHNWWRLKGFVRWVRGSVGGWGEIERTASWATPLDTGGTEAGGADAGGADAGGALPVAPAASDPACGAEPAVSRVPVPA